MYYIKFTYHLGRVVQGKRCHCQLGSVHIPPRLRPMNTTPCWSGGHVCLPHYLQQLHYHYQAICMSVNGQWTMDSGHRGQWTISLVTPCQSPGSIWTSCM